MNIIKNESQNEQVEIFSSLYSATLLENTSTSFKDLLYRLVKRVFEIIFSLALLIITAPVLVFFIIIISIESPGSPIFKQMRVGHFGKEYTIYKLRSMRNDAESNGPVWAALGDDRVTRVGKFIRNTRIDELPQLLNVLKGDMSLVGPRPLLVDYLPLYNTYQKHRHDERPGLSGLAQVNGRNAIGWDKKFDFDMRINRRDWLKTAFLGGAALAFSPLEILPFTTLK